MEVIVPLGETHSCLSLQEVLSLMGEQNFLCRLQL